MIQQVSKGFLYLSLFVILFGSSLKVFAQSLTVKPALELIFPTVAGNAYRLMESDDLLTWQPLSIPFFGTGSAVSHLVPASSPQRFYQVESVPLRDLDSILEGIRSSRNVPALACAVVVSNRIVGIGATGLRKAGVTNAPVTAADKWHHGSITKSMTATLAAILVHEGRIQWTNTLADIFPDLSGGMHAGWRAATLEQLTANRGGAPGTMSSGLWNELWLFPGTPRDARRRLLVAITASVPSSTPGTRYEYSNAGFAIAGHMLETIMDRPWEDLLREELFVPLGMNSAGFGVPATPRHIDHPWGHNTGGTPIAPGTDADNPPAIGPAGTVHCSVTDLALYTAFHVMVHRRDTPLLPRTAGVKLHTALPNNANYAHGWIAVPRPWAGGNALTHTGSNLQWFSNVWLAPEREFAVIALCNTGSGSATVATDDVAVRMIQEFLQ